MKKKLNNKLYVYFSLIFCFLLLGVIDCSKVKAEASTAVKILDNGDAAGHIDLAFIGSGFTTEELDTYKAKVQNNVDKMFTVNWFIGNKTLLNIWRIDAVSPESGNDLSEAVLSSESSVVPYDILVVLHNYDGQETYSSKRVDLYKFSDGYVVIAHELGHVIGKLDDEYFGCPICAAKCDGLSKRALNVHDKPNNEKWQDLVATAPYEGARFCDKGLWRPSENSIMRDSANSIYFDAVGMKAMDLGAGKILTTIENSPPSLSISGLSDDDTKSGSFTAEAVTTDASGIERVEFYWAKAGETSKSIKIDRSMPYDVTIDTTKYDNGQYYLDTFSYDKNWNYTRLTRVFNIANVISEPEPEPQPEPQPASLNVPIIVQEALTQDSNLCKKTWDAGHACCQRQNIPGMDRVNEPLTVGIPLAEDSGINSINQLGLSGANIQQFRPLAYWPNGNIKWALVDTQVSVPKETAVTINLVSGSGNNGGSDLAVDEGSYISINTGIAQFKVKKKNFNFFDKVTVNNKDMVIENNTGGLSVTGYEDTTYTLKSDNTVHTLVKDRVYDSKNDADSTAIIEENGPVRAVVKAMGAFKDTQGNRFMDYTVRLHFYKGKPYVKAIVILRHGQEEIHPNDYPGFYYQMPRVFSNMQLNIPLNLAETKQFEFADKDSVVSGGIDNTAYMYQAFSMAHRKGEFENDKNDGTTGWSNPPMERIDGNQDTGYIQKGLEIKNGAAIIKPLGDENEWTNGFAEIKDQTDAGLSVVMQYMSAYWPASVEFSNQGNVEIGVFSEYNSKKDIKMAWAKHETREIMLDFHTASVDNTGVLYRIEHPVTGRTTLEQYRTSKAILGQEGLISAEEMDTWFKTNYGQENLPYNIPKNDWLQDNTGICVWRFFFFSGTTMSDDCPLDSLFTFLKTGAGGRYMSSLQKVNFHVDSGILRTDGFDYSQSNIRTDYRYSIIDTGTYNAPCHFDYEHNHWLGLPIYYYLTGNEEIKEAINDYMEEFLRINSLNIVPGDRMYSRFYRTFAIGYEFTGNAKLLVHLKNMTNAYLDSRDALPLDAKPAGRNMERGYVYSNSMYDGEPVVSGLFLIPIHIEDTWQGVRVLKTYDKSYPRIEELEDYLLGISQFVFNEDFVMKPDGTDFGDFYYYLANKPNQWIESETAGVSGNYMRKDDTSRGMWLAYIKTGDNKYLERGKKILARGGGAASTYQFSAQELMYADLHGVPGFWQYINDVQAANVGANKYTLNWQVPEGATGYQIKFSDKPIMDWLGFDQFTRTYQYDPADYTAFFAAWNIDNEPKPLEAGARQSFSIDIPAVIASYNSARALTPGNPSYITYDAGKQYYFSIKYLSGEPQSQEELKGDINGDGAVDVQDVQLCVNIILGIETREAYVNKAKAVVEPEDECTVSDLQKILNVILGG